MNTRTLSALAAVVVAQAASGQVIEATARLTNAQFSANNVDNYNETAIAVSRINPSHLITGCNYQPYPIGGSRRVFYGISTTGILGASPFSETGYVPTAYPSTYKWFDPTAGASQTTDTLFFGCLMNDDTSANPPGAFFLWRNAPATGTLSATPHTQTGFFSVGSSFDDKGFIAIGPGPSSGANVEQTYYGFARRSQLCEGSPIDYVMWRRWDTHSPSPLQPENATRILPGDLDPAWNPDCQRQGRAPATAIIQSGSKVGGLAMAYRQMESQVGGQRIEFCFNANPTGSVSGWSNRIVLNQIPPPGIPETIFGISDDSIPGSFTAPNYPSIAVDRTNPNVVYVAFVGSLDSNFGDQNVDVYVARIDITPEQPTFQVARITDAMLGDPAGTDQFFPAVTADIYGGINLAYIRIDPTGGAIPRPLMSIRYARLPTFTANPIVRVLTPDFYTPQDPFSSNPVVQRIGEYISIDSSSCLVYVSYFRTEPEDSENHLTNVYVTRLSLCIADVNDSGEVDPVDAGAFASAYVNQSSQADVNQDGTCNATDISAFLNAYTCGCGTPQ